MSVLWKTIQVLLTYWNSCKRVWLIINISRLDWLTFIVKLPGCISVLKVAVNGVLTQDKLTAESTDTICPRAEIFSSKGQSGQYTPSQQNK